MPIPYAIRLLSCITAAVLLLAGCRTELPLPGAGAERQIVLLGELSGGDSVAIRAGQSTPLSSANTGPLLIEGLTLSLEEEGGTTTALFPGEDGLTYTLYTIPYSSPHTLVPGRTYRLRGEHPELRSVTADVRIPTPFTATLRSKAFSSYNGDSVLSFDIELNDPAATGASYVIEAVKQQLSIYGYFYFDGNEYLINDYRALYDSLKSAHVPLSERYDTSYSGSYARQPLYTTDPGTEHAGSGRLLRRIFLPGTTFGGSTHRIQVMLPLNALFGEFGQHAQTVIYVKSVAPDYHAFLKAYEQYDPTMGLGGNAAPAKLEGNVQGGFGMLGGVYKWSVSVIY